MVLAVENYFKDCQIPWLQERTILLCRAGSHAYGTNHALSDEDYRGIAVPPRANLLGLHDFNQYEHSGHLDMVIFGVKKAVGLLLENNPSMLEVLFCDPSDHIHVSPQGQMLLDNRHLFLSRKIRHTFGGFAYSQMRRLKLHRKRYDFGRPPIPQRKDYGLPDRTTIPKDQLGAAQALIRKRVDSWGIDFSDLEYASRLALQEKWADTLLEMKITDMEHTAAKSLGYSDSFLEVLAGERRYKSAMDEYTQFVEWEKNRNPERAAMEQKFGYDLKFGTHIVRLYTTCLEALETGHLQVKRPDADLLRAVKAGAWTFEQLQEFSDEMIVKLDAAEKVSPLPHGPSRSKADDLLCNIAHSMI